MGGQSPACKNQTCPNHQIYHKGNYIAARSHCIVLTNCMRILFLIEVWKFDDDQTKLDVTG